MSAREEVRGWRRALPLLRILLGLGILAFVAGSLPWKDQLTYRTGAGVTLAAPGEVVGDWRLDACGFQFEGQPELAADWPEEALQAARSGERLDVHRTGEDGAPGYNWKIGMPRTFRELRLSGLAQAMALFSLGMLIVVTRWWRLLAVAGCPTSWGNAFRLTFLGMFFNLAVPGLTGGDLIKGVIAAKENPTRRADALVSVLVDRLLGLGVLAALGAVVILISGETFQELRGPVLTLLAIGALGFALYANKPVRKATGLSALVDRLPFGEKLRSLDRAAMLYLRHPVELGLAILFSLANHLLIIFGIAALGGAFGVEDVDLIDYLVLVPVANIVSALPVAPGGWGVGEAVFKFLFEMIGASGVMGVAISVTFRLCQLTFGFIGGIFMLLPSSKAEVREAAQ